MALPWASLRAVVVVLATASVAAWAVGQLVSDRYLWSQLLLWIPTPVAAGAAIVAVLAACTPRCRGLTLFAAAVVGGGLVAFGLPEPRAPQLALSNRDVGKRHEPDLAGRSRGDALSAPEEPNAPEASGHFDRQGLRLLHCNIHWPSRRDAPHCFEFARLRTEDLVVFTSPGWLLLEGRGKHLEAAGWKVLRVGSFAVLTRLPVLEARTLLRADGVDVTLLRVDASSRGIGEIAIGLADLPSNPLRPRMAMAREARARLDRAGAPALDLVIGDLNLTRGSAALRTLFPGMEDAFDQAGRGLGASFPDFLPLWHIDHVLVGPRLAARDYRLADFGLSRHRAQLAEIGPAPTLPQEVLTRRPAAEAPSPG